MTAALMTPEEAWTYLGISRATLFRLLADDEIGSVKVRGQLRFTQADLDDFVARNRRTPKGLVPVR